MKKRITPPWLLLLMLLVCAPALFAQEAAQPPAAAAATDNQQKNVQEYIDLLRADVRQQKDEIMGAVLLVQSVFARIYCIPLWGN